jgi:choline dehydrogenase
MDHSQVFVPAFAKSQSRDSPCLQTLLRLTSDGATARNDMQLCVLNRVDTGAYAPGHRFDAAPTMACVLLQYSQSEGTVDLQAHRDKPLPHVTIDYTGSAHDRDRYRSGLRELAAITRRPEFTSALDISWNPSLLSDDAELDRTVKARVQTAHHPIRTARMGTADDNLSVVDQNMRFLGIDGLYVADASVIPVPIRSNINLTCLALGDRAAEILLDELA